jgi:hypothetical protein
MVKELDLGSREANDAMPPLPWRIDPNNDARVLDAAGNPVADFTQREVCFGVGLRGSHAARLATECVNSTMGHSANESIVKMMHEIAIWADSLLPHRTPMNALTKLVMHEIPELTFKMGDPLELADLLILVLDLFYLHKVDPVQAVQRKMTINRSRRWMIDGRTQLMSHHKSDAPIGEPHYPRDSEDDV